MRNYLKFYFIMKLTKKEQYMEKKIAIVRLHRGVLDPITQVNKLMTFICDIEDVKKGDFVVVELSMKTFHAFSFEMSIAIQ